LEKELSERPSFTGAMLEVLRVALPLMISTGTFSLVLFADRTLLLWYQDGSQMSAAMAAGNLYWTLVCMPIGIASMTGAIVAQYVGSGKESHVGRFLWQAVWFALAVTPIFVLLAWAAPWMFRVSGQPEALIAAEATYLRILMIGAVGSVIETGLSGFFSGTQRTRIIMWASVATGVINVILDVWFIFGGLGVPALGIVGAGWASVIAFWIKTLIYALILLGPMFNDRYRIRSGMVWDAKLLYKLLFFGIPAGLQYVTEAGIFTLIVLQIGQLGDIPLRATTMAINFNMVAFIPLIGVSIAASVLVGHHLTSTGVAGAIVATRSALAIAIGYSFLWASLYLLAPDLLLSFYRLGQSDPDTLEAIALARTLLRFVAVYVFFDSAQLILTGALRGAGDTWFVLVAAIGASAVAILFGVLGVDIATEVYQVSTLHWWWAVITIWVWLLAVVMIARYRAGRWQTMRMVS
jgi:multidrug resistance protein, MATE family